MSGSNYGWQYQFNESVSAVTATPSMLIGTPRVEQGDQYLYVFNTGNSQINPGNIVILSATTSYSVTVSSVTSVDTPIGVCKHSTITTGAYGWIVTKGFVPLRAPTNSALAVADYVQAGSDGTVTVPASATSYLGNYFGKVLQATASAGLGFGWVNCM